MKEGDKMSSVAHTRKKVKHKSYCNYKDNNNLQKLDKIMLYCDDNNISYADYQKNLYKDKYDVKKQFRKQVKK